MCHLNASLACLQRLLVLAPPSFSGLKSNNILKDYLPMNLVLITYDEFQVVKGNVRILNY